MPMSDTSESQPTPQSPQHSSLAQMETPAKAYQTTVHSFPTSSLHRVHYSIVLAGEQAFVRNIQLALTAWLHAVQGAFEYMWKCRYIHRDISSNIVLVVDGRGILPELEYTKKYKGSFKTDGTPHDVQVGTWFYMAVEIATKEHLFAPGLSAKRPLDNLLHDLESCWWGVCWQVFSNTSPDDVCNLEEYREQFDILFPCTIAVTGGLARGYILYRGFPHAIYFFRPSSKPLRCKINNLRKTLVGLYEEAYRPFESGAYEEANEETFDTSHVLFTATLAQIIPMYPLPKNVAPPIA
ncbi:hypothetical protein FRB95_014839 [Tulasnella sp. JGI-2019a]|nr:hypothetical protein FRB95_014839 [Tulasnella sp. JGI-2019a]